MFLPMRLAKGVMSVIDFRRNKVENGNFTVINARLLDRFGQTLYHPPLILLYEAIAFQPKPPLRARFFCCFDFAKRICAGCRRCKPQASRLRQPCNFTFPVSLPFPASGRLNLSDAGVVVFQG